jgi:perosamine synthetase
MIPVCEPLLDGNEQKYINDCLATNWISSEGTYLKEFERKFSAYCGCKYGVATTNGTTALHLAMAVLRVPKSREVIIPTFTIASCAFAVRYVNAHPVFADCDPVTFNIIPEAIEKLITPKTVAIMAVHLYGHPCDMEAINAIAKAHNLPVIEDAAEAIGSEINGTVVGGFGTVGCFSFYSNKIITTGEGGMLVTNDLELATRARVLRNLAHSKVRFQHEEIGYNFRMTNIQAAMGLAQLENVQRHIDMRRHNAALYTERLRNVQGLTLPPELPGYKNTYWMYSLLAETPEMRDGLTAFLADHDIGTRTFFIPMHRQVMMYDTPGRYPIAESIYKRGFYLPSGTGLTEAEIDTVCNTIKEFMGCV